MRSDRSPTSTLEFLLSADASAGRLPTFEQKVVPDTRRRAGQLGVFVALLALGLVLAALATFLLG